MSPRIGSLFTGYGGLDEGVRMALGGHLAWFSEIDPGARKVLAHHWPDVPNLGDITAIDWSTVEPIDVLTGGFPCQGISHAGKGLGLADERSGLWAEMARAIDGLRPQLVVIENVAALRSARSEHSTEVRTAGPRGGARLGRTHRALGVVLADLADLGYDARWGSVRASDVGAPHRRERVFIVAYPAEVADGKPWHAWGKPSPSEAAGRRALGDAGRPDRAHVATLPTPAVNDMGAGKTVEEWDEWRRSMRAKHGNGNGHGNSLAIEAIRYGERFGPYADAVARWSHIFAPAPLPTEPTGQGGRQRLSPRFAEWMMGVPEGHVTGAPGLPYPAQLKALGNGVVPQQAAYAVRRLLS